MAIRAKVKKPFPYARDGIHSRQMQVGEVDEFAGDVFAGLEASGHLEKTSEDLSAPMPEPDWSAMGDNELVALILGQTGVTVKAGDLSHEALVAKAKEAFAAPPKPPRKAPEADAGATDEGSAKGRPAAGKGGKA